MADYIPQIPEFIAKTAIDRRHFKRDKRRELRELKRVANKFLCASAYIPDGAVSIRNILDQIKTLEYDLSVTSWGR